MENYLNSLPVGKDRAISAATLASRWNCSERHVRTIVADLRKSGEWICSGNEGYWIADDFVDISETVLRMTAHAIEELRSVSEMRKNVRFYIAGQMRLEELIDEVEVILCED